jgi:prephenate dehydrogenase
MGPIGASIGLALKRAHLPDLEVVGTSGNGRALSAASKIGAVDSTTGNLRSAITDAGLVILDTHVGETLEILEAIGPVLDDGCIVTDTCPTKVPLVSWAEKNLPRGISFVGGRPMPKSTPDSVEQADPSIFRDTEYCIIPSKSADQASVRTVVGMVERLEAKPLFLDPHEHDSYAAAMTYLPVVVSSAFMTATAGSESWREMHRLATSEFRHLSELASRDPQDSRDAAAANPDTLVHWLDQLITVLYDYRNRVKDGSDALLDSFINAWEAHARWEAGAVGEDEDRVRIPTAGDTMATFLVGGRLAERYREYTQRDKKKKASWKYLRKT